MTEPTQSGISRRTLAKGAAWSVPAAAVVAAAPAYAKSPVPPPPPPVFNWNAGCGTTGNGKGGCNGVRFTAQVPVFVKNFTGQTLQFQIVGAMFWPGNGTKPANFTLPQLWTNNGTQNNCTPRVTALGCNNYPTVTLANGECANLWIVGPDMGNASNFWAKIRYRWVTPPVPATPTEPASGCELVGEAFYLAEPDQIISPNNCDNLATPVTTCSANARGAQTSGNTAAKSATEATEQPATLDEVEATTPTAEPTPTFSQEVGTTTPTPEPTPTPTPEPSASATATPEPVEG